MVDLVSKCELWCDESGDAFLTFPVNEHFEYWPLRSRETKRWLSSRYYRKHGGAVGGQAMEDALRNLEAMAVE